MRKQDYFILFFILIIAFIIRLYKIDIPLADYHSWRQADTAAVARNFTRYGFDLLHPRFDDLSSIQSGKENPLGYRFVEFPLYNAFFALFYKYLPAFSLEIYGRLTTILFSLLIISIIYYLSLKEAGRLTAILAAIIYSISPFFVFFSRVVLPETMATALVFLSIFFIYLSFSKPTNLKKKLFFLLSLTFFSLSLLIKPTTIFYSLVLVYLFFQNKGKTIFKKKYFYLFFILSYFPFILWRYYIRSFPEGIPANDWLINYVNTSEGLKKIFFRPAFFRWIFFERINIIIFGGYLTGFFLLGVFQKTKNYFLHIILIAALVYLFVFQGGNVQHEYYQTLILPPLAIFVSLGMSFILKNSKFFLPKFFSILLIIFLFLLSWYFSYYKVRDYYQYPVDLPQIANIVNSLTQPEDKIITDRTGDTTLLYLMDRKGAPAIYKELSDLKNLGYKYLVTLNKETIEGLKQKKIYSVVFENDKFALFKL